MITRYLTAKSIAALLFLSGFVPLTAALISQYVYELAPCILCIYQRVPFVIVMILAVMAFLIKNERVRSGLFLLSIFAFIINAGIAFYHVGVEEGWWESVFTACQTQIDVAGLDYEELLIQLNSAPNVPCDKPAWTLFGISTAGYNVLYCLGAAGFFAGLLYFFNRRKA